VNRSRSVQGLAKMLAYVLGRRPDEFGLVPDGDGFVRVKDLLKALHEEEGWRHVNPSHINEVLLSAPEAGLELADGRIRSRSHSSEPAGANPLPKLLYAFIRRRAWPHVHLEGIQAAAAPGVLLASDRAMAERLGRRIDPDPVILTVNAQLLAEKGQSLAPAGEGLFMTETVPPGTFSGPPLPKDKPDDARVARPKPAAEPAPMAGSFAMDMDRAEKSAHVPASLKLRTAKGKKLDRKRLKKGGWSREQPPWRQ
jgi:putative RNA 2'-phosphotransferase